MSESERMNESTKMSIRRTKRNITDIHLEMRGGFGAWGRPRSRNQCSIDHLRKQRSKAGIGVDTKELGAVNNWCFTHRNHLIDNVNNAVCCGNISQCVGHTVHQKSALTSG